MSALEHPPRDSQPPIRIYRYPSGGWRRLLADLVATLSLTILCGFFVFGGAFLSIEVAIFLLPAACLGAFFGVLSSLAHRVRRRHRIRLYRDRIVWDTALARCEARLTDLGQAKPLIGDQGRGFVFPTPEGKLILPEEMEGFGDLVRRIEGVRFGRNNHALPPSRREWEGPDVFRYGGRLRTWAAIKFAFAIVAFLLAGHSSEMFEFLFFFAILGTLIGLALLDIRQFQNARIERIGERLFQFDRWNHPVASLSIATIHHVATHTSDPGAEGRIYGDDGVLTFGRHLERPLALVREAIAVVSDRYRNDPKQDQKDLPPLQVLH